MLACPNCGGQLKFNIPSQDLWCEYCNSHFDPYKLEEGKNAKEEKTFDTTVFICPQCGGEIIGEDTSAAEFCSFCGASTVLESRISKERRPGYIIPFQKTKDECKKEYSRYVKKNIFAPKELRDTKSIDSFRGIYMPYWVYHIDQKKHVNIRGTKSYRQGDYRCTDIYAVEFNLNAYYKGLTYDASSSFDDNISACIAPYDVRGMKEFVPSVLSGFYADTADVDCNIYIEDAKKTANEETADVIESHPQFSGLKINALSGLYSGDSVFNTQCEAIDSALFPVWFMSYRKNDRVAYAVVNGQTGKVSADVPVDVKKYLLLSLSGAIPVFLLLNLILTVLPSALITISSIMAVITQFIYSSELKKIAAREKRSGDKGYLSENGQMNDYNPSVVAKKKKRKNKSLGIVSIIMTIGVLIPFIAVGASVLPNILKSSFLQFGVTVVSGIAMGTSISSSKKTDVSNGFPVYVLSFIAVLIGFAIRVFKPVSDIYYYASAILILISVVFNNIGIINRHNILTTRKLPQFNRHGGDDRA